MRRGGILLLLIVVLILALSVGAYLYLQSSGASSAEASPTPQLSTIVVMAQPIQRDDLIIADALEEIPYPEDKITTAMFRKKDEVADIYYAKYPLVQGQPITRDLIADRPGTLPDASEAAKSIPSGLTAVTIPISRLGAVGFAIRPGDRVNVIATTTFVDLDSTFQSQLPNNTAVITGAGFQPEQLPILTMNIAGGTGSTQGRAELEPTLNQAIYLVPSEPQRPRLVSQMILQNIQVLHVGDFNLVGDQFASQAAATQAPVAETDPAAQEEQAPPPVPDIVTLLVSPQDAVSLTYLIYSNARLTLTLRSPEDPNIYDIESVTLQYLISLYDIALPARLPYGLNPRLDELFEPVPNIPAQ